MITNNKALYAAFKAKDARFDGRFFVGISSTGIYCRPVCKARQAKIENCTFYNTAAEAEQAGYRPCLLCRPELAPGTARVDATADLVRRAARLLEEHCGSGQNLTELARRLDCSPRHLRRVFSEEYNVSPVQYLQTCRLLLAKNLLTDTGLSILEIALASGFNSLRRFNDAFKKQYNLAPTALRKQVSDQKKYNNEITLLLGYRPPYHWAELIRFLSGRAIVGVEVVKDNEYLRTVHLKDAAGNSIYGWIRVGHQAQKNALSITLSESLLPVLPQVLARIRQLFDLYCDPDAVYDTLQVMNDLRPELCKLGTRVPGCFNVFEMLVRTILGQQISVKAASTLASRIVEQYGTPLATGVEGLTHIFPTPELIVAMGERVADNFGALGIISARANTIYALAQALVQKEISFDLSAHPEEVIQKLMQIRGIGAWSAQYIAMRAMEWPDAFLETDAGIKKALQPYSSRELLKMAEAWRPWRSYATVNLWNTL